MTRQRLAVLVAGLAAFSTFAAAQGNRPAPPPPVDPGPVAAPKVPSTINPDSPGLAVDPKTFVIGAEDILKIMIWREPDLSGAVGVRPDGKITRPLIGDIQAAGLTPERLTNQLKEAYKEKILNPEIEIELIQVNSRHYMVQGEVNRPGMFPLVTPMTVFEALGNTGGFKEFANKKNITILRDGKVLKFNWEAYAKGDKKAQAQNIPLLPGDTVIVK